MENNSLTDSIILLTVPFTNDDKSLIKCLSVVEYNKIADYLKTKNFSPQDLLDNEFLEKLIKDVKKIDLIRTPERILKLIERKASLGILKDKWSKAGIYILNRTDQDYPSELKKKLRNISPPIFFVIGNKNNLNKKSIAVVGSRAVSNKDINFTKKIGDRIAKLGFSVVSGCAKGVDETAMVTTLKSEGIALGVVANNLLQFGMNKLYRDYILNNNLTLLSPYNPEAKFNVGNAMGRNKIIYCLSEISIVVNSTLEKGGTWSGAIENIKKKWVPIVVNRYSSNHEGNNALVKMGAIFMPKNFDINFIQKIVKKNDLKSKKKEISKKEKSQLDLFSSLKN